MSKMAEIYTHTHLIPAEPFFKCKILFALCEIFFLLFFTPFPLNAADTTTQSIQYYFSLDSAPSAPGCPSIGAPQPCEERSTDANGCPVNVVKYEGENCASQCCQRDGWTPYCVNNTCVQCRSHEDCGEMEGRPLCNESGFCEECGDKPSLPAGACSLEEKAGDLCPTYTPIYCALDEICVNESCQACPIGTQPNSAKTACVCPNGDEPIDGICCPENYINKNGICIMDCPPDYVEKVYRPFAGSRTQQICGHGNSYLYVRPSKEGNALLLYSENHCGDGRKHVYYPLPGKFISAQMTLQGSGPSDWPGDWQPFVLRNPQKIICQGTGCQYQTQYYRDDTCWNSRHSGDCPHGYTLTISDLEIHYCAAPDSSGTNQELSCPQGYVANTAGFGGCVMPSDYTIDTQKCDGGQVYNYETQTCACDDYHVWDGSMCVSCGGVLCNTCSYNQYFDTANNQCKTCPTGSVPNLSQSECLCRSGYYLSNGYCYSCYLNQYTNGIGQVGKAACKTCPSGQRPNANQSGCDLSKWSTSKR